MTLISLKKPDQCTSAELSDFCNLVGTEGQVLDLTLQKNVEDAHILGFAMDSGQLVGVAAIKNARASYRSGLISKSQTDADLNKMPLELGYAVVAPSHRGQGLARKLIAKLIHEAAGQPVFATSATDNAPMHAALEHQGFVRSGQPYASTQNVGSNIALFIRRADK